MTPLMRWSEGRVDLKIWVCRVRSELQNLFLQYLCKYIARKYYGYYVESKRYFYKKKVPPSNIFSITFRPPTILHKSSSQSPQSTIQQIETLATATEIGNLFYHDSFPSVDSEADASLASRHRRKCIHGQNYNYTNNSIMPNLRYSMRPFASWK